MKLIKYPDRSQWNEILKRPVLETENLFDTVRNIINRVRKLNSPHWLLLLRK